MGCAGVDPKERQGTLAGFIDQGRAQLATRKDAKIGPPVVKEALREIWEVRRDDLQNGVRAHGPRLVHLGRRR